MKTIPDEILFRALELVEQGVPIQRILDQYSDIAAELGMYLQITQQLPALASDPQPVVRRKSKEKFIAQAASIQRRRTHNGNILHLLGRVWLTAAASLIVLLAISSFAIAEASASALPGDVLYGPKRMFEQGRLILSTNLETDMALKESFRMERIREIEMLLRTGRNYAVTFKGALSYFDDENWIVDLQPFKVDEATDIGGIPEVGKWTLVSGYTQNGILYAERIEILEVKHDVDDGTEPTITPVQPEMVLPGIVEDDKTDDNRVLDDDISDDDAGDEINDDNAVDDNSDSSEDDSEDDDDDDEGVDDDDDDDDEGVDDDDDDDVDGDDGDDD